MDLYNESTLLHEALKEQHKEAGDYKKLIPSLINQSNVYRNQGQLSDALNDLLHAERLAKQYNDKENLAIAIGNQADIKIRQGKLDDALHMIFKSAELAKSLNNNILNQANRAREGAIYHAKGNKELANRLFDEAETICRDNELDEHLASLYIDKAAIVKESADFHKASGLYEKAINVYENLGDR
ncbi:MAG TPA: hypothetical protein VJ951_02765, partial [Bacteroidales bacterium]|nr:hypothetical protein [Bacteroidales bacterium]